MTAERTIWITNAVLAGIDVEAARKHPLETGGLLMGYHCSDGSVVVTDLIGPGPNADHQPMEFEPDYAHTSAEIDRLWQRGDYTVYVGEWHTHPNNVALPSQQDVGVLRKIRSEPESCCPKPVMLIRGGWQTCVWRLLDRVEQMEIKPYDRPNQGDQK